ncbi:MAG: hypothetical protein A3D65_03125 [Candidatus Lloydbacteria bacterium RIFCSPHIGHO2_02_FULL_50_13]|uniref:Uncharacterized protein n=1 Tax=Candidatus Lloydbacteria bacterium RIFCSPHIGHO2_02_FULL_50_13 TaxID=1798661 RepID=A0A1G2D2W3_9BACT|nr:MAG: hypothetical protein A3D65_03125 [Candidatus Lloydbacteria bacterium RIFCSPHIGHO2_02_FULL_50_13]
MEFPCRKSIFAAVAVSAAVTLFSASSFASPCAPTTNEVADVTKAYKDYDAKKNESVEKHTCFSKFML